MKHNLHISYDLNRPGQDYAKLIEAIKTLGNWAKIHKSFWYVKSAYSAEQAVNHLKQFVDATDMIYVVDATTDQAAWNQLAPDVSKHVLDNWNKKAA